MPLTPYQIQYLKSQGYSDEDIAAAKPVGPAPSIPSTIGKTLVAHAGGLIGGGGGTLAGAEAGGLAGEALFPAGGLIPGAIIGGIAGGMGGGAAGQKAQQLIEPEELYNSQQESAEEAAQANPKTAAGTDIVASALAAGGRPSMDALRAGEGLIGKLSGKALTPEARNSLISTTLNTAVNPAINAGISAVTGQPESVGDVASQALGGAIFGGQAKWAKRLLGKVEEPSQDVSNNDTPSSDPDAGIDKAEPITAFTAKDPDDNYKIGDPQINKIFKKRLDALYPVPDDADEITKAQILTQKANAAKDLDTDGKRQFLHQQELGNQQQAMELLQAREFNENQKAEQERANEENARNNPQPEIEPEDGSVQVNDVPAKPPITATPEILDGIIARKITKPSAVQNAFPNMKLGDDEASELLTQALLRKHQLDQQDQEDYLKNETNLTPEQTKQVLQEPKGEVAQTGKETPIVPVTNTTATNPTVEPIKGAPVKLTKEEQDAINKTTQTSINSSPTNDTTTATPPQVVNHIMNDPNATTGSVMKLMSQQHGHPFQPLAKWLSDNMDKISAKVPWKTTLAKRSSYFPPGGRPELSDQVRMTGEGTYKAATVMEEAMHSMTSAKIPSEWEGLRGSELKKEMDDFVSKNPNHPVSDLVRAYYETADKLGYSKWLFGRPATRFEGGYQGDAGRPDSVKEVGLPYAMGDLHEFIAHAFMDKDFQEKLNTIPTTGNKTLWQKVVEAVAHLLGIPVNQHHMLDRVLRSSAELIKRERPSMWGALAHDPHNSPPDTADGQGKKPNEYMDKTKSRGIAVIDAIHKMGTPIAHKIGDAMKMALNKTDELRGAWKNTIVQAGKDLTARDKQQLNAAFEARRINKTNTIGMLSSQAAKRFYNQTYKTLDESGKHRIAIGEPVNQGNGKLRLLKQDPNYVPTMPNQKVMDIIRANSDPKATKDIHDKFVDYNTKVIGNSPKDAEQSWNDFTTALRGDLSNTDKSHQDWFNASRKAMGDPLPPEFREQDPVLNMERYTDRAAIDAGHYEFMEKNHEVMAALGQTKDAWKNPIKPSKDGSLAGNQTIKNGLDQWRHEVTDTADKNEHSLSSLITSFFISGPSLESHKVISNVVSTLASTSNPIIMTRALIHGLVHVNSGYETAVKNGAVKMSARSGLAMISGSATAAERMQAIAKTIRKISTLNDLTNIAGYGLVQSMNEVIIPSKMQRASRGDITQQKFLKNLNPSYDPSKTYSQAEISKYASKMAQYVHGTGDIRSLPHWMLNDGEVSGFFSLAHWSVAQTNNFIKNVYDPATRGEFGPLLTGVFGATIGGYLIKEVREKLQGKHNQIPSLTEISSSSRGVAGNPGLVGYNIISSMMYSGFGGLLSQVAKYPFDFVYKNTPQGATFPMDEVVTDMAGTLHGVSEAIANDPNINWVDLAKAVSMHVLSTNFQLGRIAINQGINNGLIDGYPAEKKELSDKMGQLRRFDMTEGLPYEDIDEQQGSYMNLEQKKFKSTQDLNKAVQELPQLVGNIVQTYRSKPDVMMQKLKALKENQYDTFPSMEQTPLSFFKYVGYLNNLEGPEKANEELMDYMKHKTINEVKASAVP